MKNKNSHQPLKFTGVIFSKMDHKKISAVDIGILHFI